MEKSYSIRTLAILSFALVALASFSSLSASQDLTLMWEETCCNAPTWHVCCGVEYPMLKTLYIFMGGDRRDVQGASFRLVLPSKVSQFATDYREGMIHYGDPINGVGVYSYGCIRHGQQPVLVVSETMMVPEINEPTVVEIVP